MQTTEGNAEITDEMWTEENCSIESPMLEFYRDKVVFLTGGTGFLGQIFIEKLLRCDAKMIYLLARPKKGKSSQERLKEILSGSLFTLLVKKDPEYMERVRVVDGNMRDLDLGLSNEDQVDLRENVEIILHAAADVRFDNTLKELSLVNLRGTREILKLAERCNKLEMFTFVSTAFSHCVRRKIDEVFYDAPISPHEMIKIAEYYDEQDDDEMLDVLTESFIRPWPNTYSFTKSLSEELVREYGKRVPTIVIRPSIIISTHEDPVPAWCNNIYGLNGMLVACGLGFLRIMVFNPDLKGDVICADFVTNSTLAAIWCRCTEIYSQRNHIQSKSYAMIADKSATTEHESKIYNVTSKKDGVTWGMISNDMSDLLTEYPTTKSIWLHRPNTTRYRLMEFFLVIFYHAIPGIMYDCLLKLIKNPRRLMPLYRKTQMFMDKLRYFMTQEWHFDNTNIHQVYEKMNAADMKFFPSDVRKYDWRQYRYNYHLGLLRYIGNIDLEDFSKARKRMQKFRIAHYFILVIYYLLLATFYFYFGRLLGINRAIENWASSKGLFF